MKLKETAQNEDGLKVRRLHYKRGRWYLQEACLVAECRAYQTLCTAGVYKSRTGHALSQWAGKHSKALLSALSVYNYTVAHATRASRSVRSVVIVV